MPTISPPARKTTIYEQSWDITGADYSKGGKYLVVYVNEDSRFAARVLDAENAQARHTSRDADWPCQRCQHLIR